MKKSSFVLLPALALTLALLSGPAQGATSAEIQQEINRLQQEADAIAEAGAALEQQLQENAGQTATTIGQKAALDQSIHQTEAEIQNTDALLQQYSLLVAQRQSDLEAAEAAQAEMQKTYQKRLRAMEENGDISYWAVLFQANSFSDLLGRIDMIREVAEADQRMLQDLKAQAQEIEAAREALRAEMETQQQTRRDLETLQASLEAQRAEADQLLLELAAAEESLSAEFQANQAQEDATRQEILEAQAAYEAALSAEEAARLAASNQNNLAGGGGSAASPGATGLIAPVDGPHVITDAYGERNHPLFGYQGFHHGIDIAKNQGTPIYAVAAGSVTRASYTDPNGYFVALAHGNGYGSIYCHMTQYLVDVGDSVSQGQVIGYVGSTGWSSGPHLHFELHVNGASVNPAAYLPLS